MNMPTFDEATALFAPGISPGKRARLMFSRSSRNNSLDNSSGSTPEHRSVTSTLTWLRGLRKHADLVNTSMAGGLVAAIIALEYLPIAGPYFVMAAPAVILFFVLGAGALARKVTGKKRKKRARGPRSTQ